MENKKWYQSTWAIIALLIFFFPAGLFLMWKYANWNKKAKWAITGFFAFIVLIGAITDNTPSSKTEIASNTSQTQQPLAQPTQTPSPTATPVPTPTPTPVPTDANGFPTDAEKVTVAQMAKVPSAYNGKKVTFTCNVFSFPKGDNGDAAGINCTDPNDYASIVQVDGSIFDLTKVNQNDTIRIYGLGGGAATGKNAYGGDVTEALVSGLFINDLTNGYQN